MRFLADESCDYAVVTALRAAGHDVSAIIEIQPGTEDEHVLALSRFETRVLLTEDKDFGNLAYAGRQETSGVILIRSPGDARRTVAAAVVDVVAWFGDRESRFDNGFVGVELGRHGPPWPVLHARRVEIPIEIAGSNPSVNCVPADSELTSQRTLARALRQVVPE